MKSISIEIINLKTSFYVNAGCFHLRVRTRELNRHVTPFISEKAFQSDHLLHAMSRFCIEWTMLWCTMWTVKHVTGHRWKHYDILKAIVLGWLKWKYIVTHQVAKCDCVPANCAGCLAQQSPKHYHTCLVNGRILKKFKNNTWICITVLNYTVIWSIGNLWICWGERVC